MGKNIKISEKIEKYINNFSFKLNSVQKEIIDYNNTLGNEKRMQVAISQCHFLHLIIKISNIKKLLSIKIKFKLVSYQSHHNFTKSRNDS